MEALKERLKEAKTKEAATSRKKQNKQKILLGAMCLAWMESDGDMKNTILDRMDKFLTRNTDRKYFGFNPRDNGKPIPSDSNE